MMGTMGKMVSKAPREVKSKKSKAVSIQLAILEHRYPPSAPHPQQRAAKDLPLSAHETSPYFLRYSLTGY